MSIIIFGMIHLVDISTNTFRVRLLDIEMFNGCLMADVLMKNQHIVVLIVSKKLIQESIKFIKVSDGIYNVYQYI